MHKGKCPRTMKAMREMQVSKGMKVG